MSDTATHRPLIFCSKSAWEPQIRREHALASVASDQGHDVVFVQAPRDVRTARGHAVRWMRELAGGRPQPAKVSLRTVVRSTVVPGHRGEPWRAIDSWLLAGVIRRVEAAPGATSVVCVHPWDWPAVASAPAARRVFDLTDDWTALMPGRDSRLGRFYRQIEAEADEIVVVNPSLRDVFPSRAPVVVPNGVSEATLHRPLGVPDPRTLVYVGTLSERFDAPLMQRVMELLPDWRLEIVGPCLYAGLGANPDPELQALLGMGPRVTWHGAMSRDLMLGILDRASVGVIPNRPERSRGQDSMKLYDYAARGKPIVTTRLGDAGPPSGARALEVDGPDQFVKAILAASQEPVTHSEERRQWARDNSWIKRWPAWSRAVFGEETG